MSFRVFVCKECSVSWRTEALGRFTLCPTCSAKKVTNQHTKVCAYRLCGKSFVDTSLKNSQKFCCPEHRRREKMFRSGKAQDELYFRANKPKLDPLCMSCGQRWKRDSQDKSVRCPACRLKSRTKVCKICGESFIDNSIKGNRKAHISCVVKSKSDFKSKLGLSLEHKRFIRVRGKRGGRIDVFESLRKNTMTWWGRLSEEIFKGYRIRAVDMNAQNGNYSPFDFQDPELGRVNVKGAKGRMGPEGRFIWTVIVEGLKQSCDYVFVVGYNGDRSKVEHFWLLPSPQINDRLIRFAPGSKEYVYDKFDVSSSWGLVVANQKLQWAISLPPPVISDSDKFSWLDNPEFLFEKGPGFRGRKGELLYRQLYPESKDVNLEIGPTSPYDFLDVDGRRVNVKLSKYSLRSDMASKRWSFARGFLPEHNCDLYSCLCLDETGKLVREYRIPSESWGERRVIHIYLKSDQWEKFLVPLKKEGLKVTHTKWAEPHEKVISVDQASMLIDSLDFEANDIQYQILKIIRQVEFPVREYDTRALLSDWEAVCNSPVRIENETITGFSSKGFKLCDTFFRHRYDATYKNLPSVRNAWEDDAWVLKAIKFQISQGDPLRPWNIFRALKALVRNPTNFRPTFAKALVSKYCPVGGLLLDPCAGYGGRAIGTLAIGRRYLGIDPHPEADRSFNSMFNFLGLNGKQASFISSAFEDISLDVVADCVLTSPPYFCIERYAEDLNQSWIRYSTWENWRDNFLRVMIDKCYQYLKLGGTFCLNVADAQIGKKVYPLVKSSIDLANNSGFVFEGSVVMPLGRFGKREKTEPILIFKK